MTKVSQLTLIFRDKLQTLNQTSTKDFDVVSLKSSSKYHYNYELQHANVFASWPAFQIPVHYPRYTKEEYEVMSEEELNRLFKLYGMPTYFDDLSRKKQFAIGAFLWEKEKELDFSMTNNDESANPNPPADNDSGEGSLMGLIAKLKHKVRYIFRVQSMEF